uniref:Uncharacterized protein n=1 Tax=Ciona intestinalis TaxID=7719 RepID=H2Y0T3_CIOIN
MCLYQNSKNLIFYQSQKIEILPQRMISCVCTKIQKIDFLPKSKN